MALTREEQADLLRAADRLSSLLHTSGWQELEKAADEKCEKLRRVAASLALRESGADQRKLDTLRGNIAGIRWFVGVPNKANSTLEEFLRTQGIEEEDDG
jgi:hypothetical protein